ncbi:alpha-amylase [Algoriphagus litoralis]|uniref:alpha-amylase n=1 Tax=Algoriphagus litoralis TaxID=2202829 RepID=UPI000DB9784F|nr:alpha-amylase [Algoriphagus litoralis]
MSEQNGVMMQFFHWYTTNDGSHWNQLAEEAQSLAEAGISSLWLPPAYKGANGENDTGYGTYDLFDLGEFDQKGSKRTKYGTKEEYLRAIKTAQSHGIQVYADIVLNHKMGADHEEKLMATPFDPNDHNNQIGEHQEIVAWTHFSFPGRKGKYSELQWHWWHFSATDLNTLDHDMKAVFLFEGKSFGEEDPEVGKVDYLMGCNIDFQNPDVRHELFYWGEWYLETTGIDGFRIDALKHLDFEFITEWINHLRAKAGKNLFAVGENWAEHTTGVEKFFSETDGGMMLFDVDLHSNLSRASKNADSFDISTVFENTLVQNHPELAVTFVSNHDTQPLQKMETVVEAWFKPLAYALILLRKSGYPCIFAADYYGAHYTDKGKDGQDYEIWMDRHHDLLNGFLYARKTFCYGPQYDYFDHPTCIGWTRASNERNQKGMAVILSTGDSGSKHMETGSPNTTYYDLTGHIQEEIQTDESGWAEFRCEAGSVSVWLPR